MECHALALARFLAIVLQELFLVEEGLLTFFGSYEPVPFAWVEPLYPAALLGDGACFQETGRAEQWYDDSAPPSPDKVEVGGGQNETASASLANNTLQLH